MKIKIFLTYFLGYLFLLTSLYRIHLEHKYSYLDYHSPHYEITNTFKLNAFFRYFVIFLEMIVGIVLISHVDDKIKHNLLLLLLTFLVIAIVLILVFYWEKIMKTVDDVFTFQPNFTSLVLHLTYATIIISVLFCKN